MSVGLDGRRGIFGSGGKEDLTPWRIMSADIDEYFVHALGDASPS